MVLVVSRLSGTVGRSGTLQRHPVTHQPSAVRCASGIRSMAAAIYLVHHQPIQLIEEHGMAPYLGSDDTKVGRMSRPSDVCTFSSSISDCLRDIAS